MYPGFGPKQLETFWSRVARGPDTDSCWPWLGKVNRRGYGVFGDSYVAHRVALALATGGMRVGKMACHHCDNRTCCNAIHMYWGDALTNARDREVRKRCGDRSGFSNGRYVDIAGQRFGRLLAMWPIQSDKKHPFKWACQCDCGNILYVNGAAIRKGNTKSCGCLHRERAALINQRLISFAGQTGSMSWWARKLGISQKTLSYRLEHWSMSDALTEKHARRS